MSYQFSGLDNANKFSLNTFIQKFNKKNENSFLLSMAYGNFINRTINLNGYYIVWPFDHKNWIF